MTHIEGGNNAPSSREDARQAVLLFTRRNYCSLHNLRYCATRWSCVGCQPGAYMAHVTLRYVTLRYDSKLRHHNQTSCPVPYCASQPEQMVASTVSDAQVIRAASSAEDISRTGQSTSSFSTEGGAMPKIALDCCDGSKV
jgi:hypothetical protein